MNFKFDLHLKQHTNWNNRVRKAYWLIFILTALCGLSAWPIVAQDGQAALDAYIHTSLITQNSILLAILLVAELIFRVQSKLQDYLIIVVGTGFATTIFALIPITIDGAQVVMLLPILVSTLYLSYTKVLFASLLTLLTYLTLIHTLTDYQVNVPVQQISLVICSIIVCTFLIMGIVKRGLDIMKAEKRVLVEEDRLISQKISMGQLVRKDALTGLDNHRTFQEQLEHILELGNVQGIAIHLAILDIDNFKKVNDNFGHWAGDIVLRRMGILIGDQCNEDVRAARYGGEEFAILFRNMDSNKVNEWLEVLYERLEQTIYTEIDNMRITISTGCYHLQIGDSKEILFQSADQALYQAKEDGKNRIVWANPLT